MTTTEKLIQPKMGLLKLAEKLGNVSEACKVIGYSRDSFYRFQTEALPDTAQTSKQPFIVYL